MPVNIEESWKGLLSDEFEKPYFKSIGTFLRQAKSSGKIIYPPGPEIFNAFSQTPVQSVKVVIIGQDPYHGEGQAHGLSFSVRKGIKIPPSLQNIYKELNDDLGIPIPLHGDLSAWSRQGVLLLNASLTVEANQPMSHSKIGWEIFTDQVIQKLANERQQIAFMLWGRFAQQKEYLITPNKHLILKASHPSPFSAYQGFFGCAHFSKANAYLEAHRMEPIHWDPDNESNGN
jgi:uracil-DNA glycosylase